MSPDTNKHTPAGYLLLLLTFVSAVHAQTGSVAGRVVFATGNPD